MNFFTRKSETNIAGFVAWLPVAVAVTGCALIAYGAAQQTLRSGADDPQIAMAEDAAEALSYGEPMPTQSSLTTDVGTSLSPFLAYYDASGEPLVSTGTLNFTIPKPPRGMLDAAKRAGENRVTWQPDAGVRIAAVVVSVVPEKDVAFVLAGRSLRETERRIKVIGNDILFGWSVTMLGSYAVACFAVRRRAA